MKERRAESSGVDLGNAKGSLLTVGKAFLGEVEALTAK